MSLNFVVAALMAVCTFGAVGLYMHKIYRGESLPYVWAWLIRGGLCLVLLLAQLSEGATYSLVLYGAQAIGAVGIVCLVVWQQGRWGRLDSIDAWAIGAAGAGLLAWGLSGNALFSILGVLAADAVATAIGVRAAVRYGRVESTAFWLLALSAASLAFISVAGAPLVLVAAPLFSMTNAVVNLCASWFVHQRQRRAPIVEASNPGTAGS